MIKKTLFLIVISFFISSDLCFGQSDQKRVASNNLVVIGCVNAELDLDLSAMQKMNAMKLEKITLVGGSRGFIGTYDYKGVSLKDVLDKAGLKGNPKPLIFLVSAADGFCVSLSWGEVFNNLCGDKILLAYEKDGKLLDEREGFVRLIIPSDKFVADRAVKWVNKIEVISLKPDSSGN